MKKKNGDENQIIEWKESWRDELLEWICGYANAQGGTLYIGVDDNGNPVGAKGYKKLLEDIPNKIVNTMAIIADVNHRKEKGKDIIEIEVSPSSYPVCYKGKYHYRSGSTKQQLVGPALTQFLMQKTGLRWDAVPVDNVTVNDLDGESFDIFRRESKRTKRLSEADLSSSNESLLKHLGLYRDGKLTRAAILLFHKNPEQWFTGIYTKIGKFSDSEIEYMDEIHGSLIKQADQTIDLLFLKYLKMSISYSKDTRVETYPYAREAIREAYFNALCHSNWSASVPVQIRVNDDSLMISNCSIFPKDWTVDTLMTDHESVPFNPDIATGFYRAGFIESWGKGIKKICDACHSIKAQAPEYTIRGEDVMVKFSAVQSAKAPKRQSATQSAKSSGALDEKLALKVIEMLKENPSVTQKEITETAVIPRRSLQRIMKCLEEEGKISREGGKRYGKWIVK